MFLQRHDTEQNFLSAVHTIFGYAHVWGHNGCKQSNPVYRDLLTRLPSRYQNWFIEKKSTYYSELFRVRMLARIFFFFFFTVLEGMCLQLMQKRKKSQCFFNLQFWKPLILPRNEAVLDD